MALDMYLLEDIYIGGHPALKDTEDFIKLPSSNSDKETIIKIKDIGSISILRGQWKNTTAIHKWFTKEYPDIFSNSNFSYVANDKLQDLLEICREVFKDRSKAVELLPSSTGPDFTSDAPDDKYYMDDIEYTILVLEGLDLKTGLYRYQASW